VSDGARGVVFEDLFELALGFLVPEVVDESDTAIETGLLGRCAGDGKRYDPEALGCLREGRSRGENCEEQDQRAANHRHECSRPGFFRALRSNLI
jgi:hypothetical protein